MGTIGEKYLTKKEFETFIRQLNKTLSSLRIVQPGSIGAGAVSHFTGLSDVPGSYSGQAGKIVDVNAGENALEFIVLNQAAVDGLKATQGPTFDHLHLTSGQIEFPAIQVPSADPNTLDDYEEGTFDVTITAGGGGTITLYATNKTMQYTKIGRMVSFSGYLIVQSVSSPLGDLIINGLPFTCGNADSYLSGIFVYASGLAATAKTMLHGFIWKGSTLVYIRKFENGQTVNTLAADVATDSLFMIGGFYFV